MAEGQRFYTDSEIINALLGHGMELDNAIRFLYRTHFNSLSNYICTNNGSEQESEDIFQEVIISFINLVRAGKFRGESAIGTFLFAMNRNYWMNELKRRQRAGIREKKYDSLQEQTGRPIPVPMEENQQNRELMKLVSLLGADCKKVLELFYYENYSMNEILRETGYESEQVVRNKKYKCLKKLQQMVFDNPSVFQQLKNFLHG